MLTFTQVAVVELISTFTGRRYIHHSFKTSKQLRGVFNRLIKQSQLTLMSLFALKKQMSLQVDF